MSLRFRRRIRILPGIYINLGKNGISTSIGPRDANVNIGKNGVYLNTGIPGTGITNREKLTTVDSGKSNTIDNFPKELNSSPSQNQLSIKESISHIETSDELKSQTQSIKSVIQEKEDIIKELQATYLKKKNGFLSIFTKKETLENLEQEINKNEQTLNDLKHLYDETKADINVKK